MNYLYNFKLIITFIFTYFSFRKISRNQKSKISVIIPTYNRGNILANSIKSVLNQTYQNIEILVIDDGSTDNTREEVNKIKDKKIKYIKLKKNKGGSNARNVGIKRSKGQYISFQDSDDIYYPDKLQKQMNNIINKNSDLDFCKINVILNNSYAYWIPNQLQEKRILEGNTFDELISNGNFISTQAILVKRMIISKYLFNPKMPRLQDYDLILRMIPKVKISYTNEVLVDLHLQNDSLTREKTKLKQAIYILLKNKYNFNVKQQKSFINYLNYLLESRFKE